jgi:thiol-disulfide isomerase/thioredoxin
MRFAALLFLFLATTAWSAESIHWYRSFPAALAEAKETSNPIFVDVYADWCVWCHKLDRDVYSKPGLIAFMKNYVTVKIDFEDGKDGAAFADTYGVTGLPTLLVIDPDGRVIDRVSGYVTASRLIGELDRVQALIDLERQDDSNLRASLELADLYMDREMYDEALSRYRRVLASPSSTLVQRERSGYGIAEAEYGEGCLEEAQQALEDYSRDFQNGPSESNAMLLLSQIYLDMKADQKAISSLRQFLQTYPDSQSAADVRQTLSDLEGGK